MKTIFDAVKMMRGEWDVHYAAIILDMDASAEGDFNILISELENWQPTLSVSPLANVTYAEHRESFTMSVTGWSSLNISDSLTCGMPPARCSVTYEKKESNPELVTVDGMQYEIGKVYEFSDDGDSWAIERLTKVSTDDSPYRFGTYDDTLRYIRVLADDAGKITPAPVELVDGAAYEFEYIAGKFIGIYDKKENIFHLSNNRVIRLDLAKNITRLVPEVK